MSDDGFEPTPPTDPNAPITSSDSTGGTRKERVIARAKESLTRIRDRFKRGRSASSSEETVATGGETGEGPVFGGLGGGDGLGPNEESGTKLQRHLRGLQNRLASFDPSQSYEWLNRNFQKQGASFYGKLITIVLCTYFLADVLALLLGNYIPEPPAARMNRRGGAIVKKPPVEEYSGAIVGRNLFNSQGLVPGEDGGTQVAQDPGGTPIRTSLPFNLVGTLILRDELRSIATIEDKSASMVYPVQVQDEIPSKARILKIEPERVIFLNIASGRREFVELPELNSNTPRITLGKPAKGAGIEQVSPTQFSISRQEVDSALGDLNNILTQARAVPHFENGMPAGYKLFQIVPGSIYSKLGLENNDIITNLNGEPVNDPGKAFSALNDLKGGANHIELGIKRNGRTMNMQFDVVR